MFGPGGALRGCDSHDPDAMLSTTQPESWRGYILYSQGISVLRSRNRPELISRAQIGGAERRLGMFASRQKSRAIHGVCSTRSKSRVIYSSSESLSSLDSLSCCSSPSTGKGSWLPLPWRASCALSSRSCSILRSCSCLFMGLFFLLLVPPDFMKPSGSGDSCCFANSGFFSRLARMCGCARWMRS
ncbi:uncharacterized protein B0I36DRAFT_4918 [Microdochium trichocladiopsis]|uniref:Uncharacterized protein n=1 Tax=Microdochium trichocladiopsis TaxID=1682393 RepID=A0A9P9BVB2_9PEZI|nr:uncharacterized protein B0I36DRAFT_4918 [Microdochium trichocladiopsis]KAH7040063.1 hypothetical protein B0I36DRAFT_4918 [Microdochium trichocladiopsis]